MAQVVQVVESTQLIQLGPQGAQYLTPSFETVKYVLAGHAHEPLPTGLAKATQDEQTEADEQIPHPEEQGTQVLLELA